MLPDDQIMCVCKCVYDVCVCVYVAARHPTSNFPHSPPNTHTPHPAIPGFGSNQSQANAQTALGLHQLAPITVQNLLTMAAISQQQQQQHHHSQSNQHSTLSPHHHQAQLTAAAAAAAAAASNQALSSAQLTNAASSLCKYPQLPFCVTRRLHWFVCMCACVSMCICVRVSGLLLLFCTKACVLMCVCVWSGHITLCSIYVLFCVSFCNEVCVCGGFGSLMCPSACNNNILQQKIHRNRRS